MGRFVDGHLSGGGFLEKYLYITNLTELYCAVKAKEQSTRQQNIMNTELDIFIIPFMNIFFVSNACFYPIKL